MKTFRFLLAALLAIVGVTTGVAQDLYICGNPITTSGTISGISGVSGSVTYTSGRLTLNNATIEATSSQGVSFNQGTIIVEGDNTISSSDYNALVVGGNVTIQGTGTLTLIGNGTGTGTGGTVFGGCGIMFKENASAPLTITGGVHVRAIGARYGVYGNYSPYHRMTIRGENTMLITQGPIKSVYLAGGLLANSPLQILTPEGASFNSSEKSVVDASGNAVNSEVIIAKEGYGTQDNPEAYAVLSGNRLVFYYDGNRAMHVGTTKLITNNAPDWVNNTAITTVDFDASYDNYRPTTTQSLFNGLTNLTTINNISRLHTDNVTNMSFMFNGCSSLTSLDLTGFNTANVTKMGSMFRGCSSLTNLDVSTFNTSAIATMTSGAMDYMFYGCSSLTELNVCSFTIGKFYLDHMFQNCSSLTTIYGNKFWSPSTSEYMFSGCTSLYSQSSGLSYDSSKTTALWANPTTGYFTLPEMAAYAVLDGTTLTFYYDNMKTERTGTKYTLTWSTTPGWAANSSITMVTFDESFANYHNLDKVEYMFTNLSELTQINNLRYLNTENVTSMNSMFYGCSQLTELDLTSFNTSAVMTMKNMFQGDINLTTIYVGSNWSTANVEMSDLMFYNCTSLVGQNDTRYNSSYTDAAYAHVDVPGNPGYLSRAKEAYAVWSGTLLTFYYDGFKSTRTGNTYSVDWKDNSPQRPAWYNNDQIQTVTFDSSFGEYHGMTYLGHMFENMDNLANINGLQYLNTESVTDMNSMFQSCTSLTELDLSHFNTANVTSMWGMFQGSSSLTSLDLSSFNTANVTDMENMFSGCTGLVKVFLTNFTTPKTPRTNKMFYNCSSLRCILCNNTWTASYSTDMFTGCTSLVGGAGTAFAADHIGVGYAHVDGGTGNPGYFTEQKTQPYALFGPNEGLTFYYDDQMFMRKDASNVDYAPENYYDFPLSGEYPSWTPAGGETWRTIYKITFDESFQNYTGLTSTRNMFYGMSYLNSITNLNYLNTESVIDMSHMFEGCVNLQTLGTYNLRANSVTDLTRMFYGCERLTMLNLQNFNPQQVTTMTEMFQGCSALAYIYCPYDWKTTNVTTSSNMFTGCTSLQSPNRYYNDGAVTVSYANPTDGYFIGSAAQAYPYAVLSADQKTLTFYYNTTYRWAEGTVYFFNWGGIPWWTSSDGNEIIETVTFDESFSNYHGLTSCIRMFYKLTALTQINHLDYLNTENVTDMYGMFYGCSSLTSLDLSTFNTANVTKMTYMFNGCTSLTSLNVSSFNTANVAGMMGMFNNCCSLTTLDISNFDTGKVVNMREMFQRCSSLTNLDLSNFNTENVKYMEYMFDNCRSLTSLDISNFNTVKVTNMTAMFFQCNQLENLDVSNFNTENVTDMHLMFVCNTNLTSLDLSNFDTENVTDMKGMFYGCSSLTQLDLSTFNTKKVTDMKDMFEECTNLVTIYCNDDWNRTTVTASDDMFKGCTALVGGSGTTYGNNNWTVDYAHPDGGTSNPGYFTVINAYAVLSTDGTTLTFYYDNKKDIREGTKYDIPWDTSTVPGWTGNNWLDDYNGTTTTVDFDISFSNYHGLTSTAQMFDNMQVLKTINHLERLNTENVTDMAYMFRHCKKLESLDVSHFNTSKVKSFYFTFSYCPSLTSLDLSNFDTSNCETMYHMFSTHRDFVGESKLKSINMSGWDTRKVTDMCSMFGGLTSLESIDVSHFNTENVVSMSHMFRDCSSLKNLDLSNFNTDKVSGGSYSMAGMFDGCSSLESLNISSFNTAKVKDMSKMFAKCSSLTQLDLSNFNTGKVTTMENMFKGCTNLVTIYCNDDWNTSTVTESTDMFTDCTALVGGKGTTYNANNVTVAYAHPDATGSPGYFTEIVREAYAVVSTDGTTLTFYYDTMKESRTGTKYDLPWTGTYPGWSGTSNAANTSITTATFDASFRRYSGMTKTSYMFYNMTALQQINNLNYLNTENVTNMKLMFFQCRQLENLDVSNFNTENVTDMSSMFNRCSNLKSLDLSHFNTEEVTTMNTMFFLCSALESLDMSNFNTANVTNMYFMFNGCSNLTSLDLSNFDTSRVSDMASMFYNCSKLETIYCNDDWTRTIVNSSSNMFYGCTKLVGGNGTTYNVNKLDVTYAHPDGGISNPGYFTAKNVSLHGDVNEDGQVTIADVTALVNIILGKTTTYNADVADVDQNNSITTADVNVLVDIILGK